MLAFFLAQQIHLTIYLHHNPKLPTDNNNNNLNLILTQNFILNVLNVRYSFMAIHSFELLVGLRRQLFSKSTCFISLIVQFVFFFFSIGKYLTYPLKLWCGAQLPIGTHALLRFQKIYIHGIYFCAHPCCCTFAKCSKCDMYFTSSFEFQYFDVDQGLSVCSNSAF